MEHDSRVADGFERVLAGVRDWTAQDRLVAFSGRDPASRVRGARS
jgi:hypothetical protein